jgi:hypothetical protein
MEIVVATSGLVIVASIVVAAIRFLRQPKYRYLGDPSPRDRRSFRETMTVWMMGPRN